MYRNFTIILFILLFISGISYLFEFFIVNIKKNFDRFLKKEIDKFQKSSETIFLNKIGNNLLFNNLIFSFIKQTFWLLIYLKNFFPILLLVFTFRSFIIEPFRIPSGSMLPTLHSGDLILVNKFNYGIRLPIINYKILEISSPKRGDILVFNYPIKPSVNYIKRIVGLPGDNILYKDKKLFINGNLIFNYLNGIYYESNTKSFIPQYCEKLDHVSHNILMDDDHTSEIYPIWTFPWIENCQYFSDGLNCTVPLNHYFTIGDNRDNSFDSRYWGFVSDNNIIGRAFFIWMNFRNLNRIGFIY